MSKNLLTGLEQKVIHKITEESWLELATDLIRCGQPASGNALDPDLPSGEEEAIAHMVAGELKSMVSRLKCLQKSWEGLMLLEG